jgi:hypothetical protein
MATTLAQLRTRAQRRADLENSSFVSDDEWKDYANEEYAELDELLLTTFEDYRLTSVPVVVVSGVSDYALPDDFYKLRGVDYIAHGVTHTLREFQFRERNRWQSYAGEVSGNLAALRYQVLGTNLRLVPLPQGGGQLVLWYAPQIGLLSTDTDELHSGIVAGWDAFVVLGMAIKALKKEEQEVSALEGEKMALRQRIEAAAQGRNASDPMRIVDVTVNDVGWY